MANANPNIAVYPTSFKENAFSTLTVGQHATDLLAQVRRPLRGTNRKEDIYAKISISRENGKTVDIETSSSKKLAPYTSNFLIQQYSEVRSEKSQILETFGESYVYFFGERTPVMQFSGELLNTEDFNWKMEFMELYDKYLRGTKLVSSRTRVILTIDGLLFGGYLMDVRMDRTSAEPDRIPFSFTMVITNRNNLTTTRSHTGKQIPVAIANVPTKQMNYTEIKAKKPASFFGKVLGAISGAIETVDDALYAFRTVAYGRKIKVPDGAGSSDYYAADLQIATRTSDAIASVTGSRSDVFKGKSLKINYRIEPLSLNNDKYTGSVTDNYDEYIVPLTTEDTTGKYPPDAINTPDYDKAVRDFLKKEGVWDIFINGASNTTLLLGSLAFGAASLVGGHYLRKAGG